LNLLFIFLNRIRPNCCWVWSLIIFLVFKCLVSVVFGPHTPTGGCGGVTPHYSCRGSRAAPPKGIFYEKCLVKYCNFIVNLDHSLCHRSNDRSYVYLRFFCPRRQPSIIYEGIVLRLCIILRDETVRE
jgi:hypothetical protein